MILENFSLNMPGTIFFGPGSRKELFPLLKREGKRVFFVTGRSWFNASGYREEFEAAMEGLTYEFCPCTSGEPDIESIDTLCGEVRRFNPDIIVGIGGGAVIDSAKAVAALAKLEGLTEDYMEGVGKGIAIETPGIPFVAMPTTSGTGAEATKNSVIKSRDHNAKKSIRSPYMVPDYVIVDPDFTKGLSKGITGMTGMDALVQLFESYVTKKAKPVPRALVRDVFPSMIEALKTLAVKEDAHARATAAYGALVSGIALANAGLGAVHGFASSLGGLTEIPHGLICSIFFNPVLDANKEAVMGLLPRLMRTHMAPEEAFAALKKEIGELIELYGLKKEFAAYGLTEEQVPEIAARAGGNSMSGNPVTLDVPAKEGIVRAVLASL